MADDPKPARKITCDEAAPLGIEIASLFLDLMAEACGVLHEAEQTETLPTGLAMALGRLDMIVGSAPDPEDVRAWLDHVTGADADPGPDVVALPPRMH